MLTAYGHQQQASARALLHQRIPSGSPTTRWSGAPMFAAVRQAMTGQTMKSPSGPELVMDSNHHLSKPVMVARSKPTGNSASSVRANRADARTVGQISRRGQGQGRRLVLSLGMRQPHRRQIHRVLSATAQFDGRSVAWGARASQPLCRRRPRPGGEVVPFEIDPLRKHCLVNGRDEIGLNIAESRRIDPSDASRRASRRGYGRGRMSHFSAVELDADGRKRCFGGARHTGLADAPTGPRSRRARFCRSGQAPQGNARRAPRC
jgi:hypothetical protein